MPVALSQALTVSHSAPAPTVTALALTESLLAAARDPSARPARAGELGGAWLAEHQAPNTREGYARDLAALFAWCLARGIEPLELTRPQAANFLQAPRPDGRPYARSTRARRHACLTGFYIYALDAAAIAISPVASIRRPRREVSTRARHLDRRGLQTLLSAPHPPREAALLRLMVYDGLRVSEVTSLDVDRLALTHERPFVEIAGKGQAAEARRKVAVNQATVAALYAYLRVRPPNPGGPVFVSRTGRRLTRQQAAKLLATCCRRAGVAAVSPHGLRASFATLALSERIPLEAVQDALGHADPRTTRIYDRGAGALDRHPAHRLMGLLEG